MKVIKLKRFTSPELDNLISITDQFTQSRKSNKHEGNEYEKRTISARFGRCRCSLRNRQY